MNPFALSRSRELHPPPVITNRPVFTNSARSALSPELLSRRSFSEVSCAKLPAAPAVNNSVMAHNLFAGAVLPNIHFLPDVSEVTSRTCKQIRGHPAAADRLKAVRPPL